MMDQRACLQVLAELVQDELVVAALGAMSDEWSRLKPRDSAKVVAAPAVAPSRFC